MRKLKNKNFTTDDKIGLLLEKLLPENDIELFMSLLNVKDKPDIVKQIDAILINAKYIIQLKDQKKKENLKRKLKKIIFDVLYIVKNKYIKNNLAIFNFVLLINTYDLVRSYLNIEEDKFRNDLNNEKFFKSFDKLYKDIKDNVYIEKDDVILPDLILQDYQKIINLLNSLLNKNIKYLNNYINEINLIRELGSKIYFETKNILKENNKYKLGQVKEDYNYYLKIKSRLNSVHFNFDDYKTNIFEDDEIKKDIKVMKSNLTKIQNLLKNFEKLLLTGEE